MREGSCLSLLHQGTAQGETGREPQTHWLSLGGGQSLGAGQRSSAFLPGLSPHPNPCRPFQELLVGMSSDPQAPTPLLSQLLPLLFDRLFCPTSEPSLHQAHLQAAPFIPSIASSSRFSFHSQFHILLLFPSLPFSDPHLPVPSPPLSAGPWGLQQEGETAPDRIDGPSPPCPLIRSLPSGHRHPPTKGRSPGCVETAALRRPSLCSLLARLGCTSAPSSSS